LDSSQIDGFVFDADLSNRLKYIYGTCLDFIIQVFSHQDQTLPAVKQKLRKSLLKDPLVESTSLLLAGIERSASSFSSKLDEENETYSLIFWNDEFHNFNAARDAIIAASGVDANKAMSLAGLIDKVGRTNLKTAKKIETLIPGFKDAIRTNFTASILTDSEISRQDLAITLIDWMSHSLNHSDQSFQSAARTAFCESLCSNFIIPAERTPYWNTVSKDFNSYTGLLHGSSLPHPKKMLVPEPMEDSTRLQYLLFFDIRFWKAARSKLHTLLISTLVSDLKYKRIASEQIITIYPLLVRNYTYLEREPLLNALDEIATQFFTCPTNSTDIISGSLDSVLSPITDIVESTFTSTSEQGILFRFPRSAVDQSTSKRSFIKRALADLDYIFDKAITLEPLYRDSSSFSKLFQLVGALNRCWQIKRKVGEHVQAESYEFVSYLNVCLQALSIISRVTSPSKLANFDRNVLVRPIKRLITYTVNSNPVEFKDFKNFSLIDFEVSKGYGSFINPSSALLGKLVSFYSTSSETLREVVDNADFLPLADLSLRSIVMQIQIECQFWIRNGNSPAAQALTYKSHLPMRENLYFMDIYLTQASLIVCDPSRAFLNIIDRFELLPWFNNELELESTVYEEKVFNIVEKLVTFLYTLLTYRDNFIKFNSNEKRLENKYRSILISHLFAKPKPYSDIEELVEGDEFNDSLFEEVLNDVSVFNAPKGLNDDGLYSLKPELLKEVDPLQLNAQLLDYNDALSALLKALAKDQKSTSDVVVQPQITKLENFKELGDFTRTIEFAKLIARLMDYAISKEDESFIPIVLHLLHGAILDNEQVNGENSIIQTFMQVPIYENLFNIATLSSFSKPTKTKADAILSSLIVKDSENILETLASCFGIDEVNNYKAKKQDPRFYVDETESERKRRLAKERQRKIMERMQKKQKKFLDKNQQGSTPNSNDDETTFEETSNTCVLCQGEGQSNGVLCAPLAIDRTNIFRRIPRADPFFFERSFLDWGEDSIENSLHAEGLSFGEADFKVLNVGSSCNHQVHFKCLHDYLTENDNILEHMSCPLCKTRLDINLPTLGDIPDINDIIHEQTTGTKNDLIFARLEASTPPEALTGLNQLLDTNFKSMMTQEGGKRPPSMVASFSSSSIRQAEIATRINGQEAYTDYLNQIPEQTYKTLKLVVQNFILIDKRFPPEDHKKSLVMISRYEDFLTCFIVAFFRGNVGFHQSAIEWISFFFKSYLSTFLTNYGSVEWKTPPIKNPREVSKDELELYRKSIGGVSDAILEKSDIKQFFTNDEFAANIINRVEKILIPDIRTLTIFYKLLNPAFELKISKNEGSNFNLGIMLEAFKLPSLFEIISTPTAMKFHIDKIYRNALPYAGVIKLVDLPSELSYFTTSQEADPNDKFAELRFKPTSRSRDNLENRIDYAICLTCGSKFHSRLSDAEARAHSDTINCSSIGGGIYFYPSSNEIKIHITKGLFHLSKKVNAPYLNSHGQSGLKAIQHGHTATLNVERYKHLNNLWLSGGIFPFLSRNSVPVRVNPGENAGLFGNSGEAIEQFIGRILGMANNENPIDRRTLNNMLENQFNMSIMDYLGGESDEDYNEEDHYVYLRENDNVYPLDDDEEVTDGDDFEHDDIDDVDEDEFDDALDYGTDDHDHSIYASEGDEDYEFGRGYDQYDEDQILEFINVVDPAGAEEEEGEDEEDDFGSDTPDGTFRPFPGFG
jgi:E3 ubiquitin-protein ligase UBR1